MLYTKTCQQVSGNTALSAGQITCRSAWFAAWATAMQRLAFRLGFAPDVLIFAVPNGGLRSKVEAARLKWTGVVAPGGRIHFLEVKTTTGRLLEAQRDIMALLGKLGAQFATVTGIDDVRRAFAGWGIETREASR
jgi:hypothetical protein